MSPPRLRNLLPHHFRRGVERQRALDAREIRKLSRDVRREIRDGDAAIAALLAGLRARGILAERLPTADCPLPTFGGRR
jgi:hypothetical protein